MTDKLAVHFEHTSTTGNEEIVVTNSMSSTYVNKYINCNVDVVSVSPTLCVVAANINSLEVLHPQ